MITALHELDEMDGRAGGAAAVTEEDALLGVHAHRRASVSVDGAADHLFAPAALVQVYAVVGEDGL
jgi:hypothetical protein